GNGQYLGEFKLNKLPVTILNFPEGGSNIDTITVCAPDTIANCCHSKTYEGLHCPANLDCHILELSVTEMSCTSDSTFTGTINFVNQNTSGAGFDLWINNHYFGTYPYNSLPLTIPNMPSNGSAGDLIKVCDHEFQDCCKAKEFQGPSCAPGGDCHILELSVLEMSCTSDSTYKGTINFVNQNTSGAGFDLWINNHYFGTYSYNSIPLTLTNIPSNGTAGDIIKVCDHEFQDCCKSQEFQGPACSGTGDCHILELNVTDMACTSDSTYSGIIHFVHQNTSGAGFDLWINNHYFGTYPYNSIPLTLTNIPSNGTAGDLIKVCDHEFQDCCKAKEFQGPACAQGNCEINNLTVIVGDCNSDNTYHLTVNFTPQNPGSTKFDLFANNIFFGTYFYAQLPLVIPNFPKSGNSHDVVRVCDHELEDCCRTKEFESPSCSSGDCHLYDLTVTTVECTSPTTYKVIVNFQHQYTLSDHFDLYANGVYFGYYAYTQLPLTISNFPASGNPVDKIKVSDNDNPTCSATKEFTALNCTTQDCSIHELTVNLGDCSSDSTYSITINFIVQNQGSPKFDLFANGNYFGTYFYTQLPLTIPNFPDSGNNNDHLSVCDHELVDCCKTKEFSSPNCANGAPDIYDLQAQVFNCIGIKFSVKLSFNYKNQGINGFKLEGNGIDYGSFDYSQLPVTLGGLNADNFTEYEFSVVDNDFPEANDYMFLGKVKCTTSSFDPKSGEVPFIYYFNGDNLIIKGKELIEFSGVNAFDIMGRQLFADKSNSTEYIIKTGKWIPGNYILFVQSKNGQSSVLITKSK
ncbi:MAG TPA: hypothetical protein VK590_16030, partial [Saprospiraceae bacterium]|nr:hypothetical protein [Saprospiraceae bacterium]